MRFSRYPFDRYMPDADLRRLDYDMLDTGEETLPRRFIAATNASLPNQQLRLTYFTARRTELISQVRTVTGGTAAGATPTLIRIGLYTANAAGDLLALKASTANDTTLYAATNTAYTKSFSAVYTKQAGQRYALGILVVTAATAPQLMGGGATNVPSEVNTVTPRLLGVLTGQSDLPSSALASSLNNTTGNTYYAALLP